jgi:hypothetical protein
MHWMLLKFYLIGCIVPDLFGPLGASSTLFGFALFGFALDRSPAMV